MRRAHFKYIYRHSRWLDKVENFIAYYREVSSLLFSILRFLLYISDTNLNKLVIDVHFARSNLPSKHQEFTNHSKAEQMARLISYRSLMSLVTDINKRLRAS